jgi:hypothetical protein
MHHVMILLLVLGSAFIAASSAKEKRERLLLKSAAVHDAIRLLEEQLVTQQLELAHLRNWISEVNHQLSSAREFFQRRKPWALIFIRSRGQGGSILVFISLRGKHFLTPFKPWPHPLYAK